MTKENVIAKAKNFTINAHNSIGHRRKYTDEPYYVHPERVARLVAEVTSDAEVIAAAWLHDVLEDVAPKNPDFNNAAILSMFGERVLKLVLEVTDISKPEDGNRLTRKKIDTAHLANASAEGQTIKLADLIDNIIDISKHDRNFARVFRKEAMLNLHHLRLGNKSLYNKLKQLLQIDKM